MENQGVNKDFSKSYTASSDAAAQQCYDTVAARLLNVNEWHLLTGKAGAVFQRMDGRGYALNGPVKEGDYMRINIPGPGSSSNFDWVRVEQLEEKNNSISFTVRPCPDPTTPGEETAHFLSNDATSHFSVVLEGNSVTAMVKGRHEKPNAEGDSIAAKVRNVITGIGAIAGAANIQWNKLVDGLVAFEVE